MKDAVKITVVLTFVCAFCAFLLSFVNGAVEERVKANQVAQLQDALNKLSPKAQSVEEVAIGEDLIYKLLDEQKKLIAYGFVALGQGYQDKIKMLVVSDKNLRQLEGIEVLESQETPGLGAKIKEADFLNQFTKKDISRPLECTKLDISKKSEIKAITSATISSRAVVNTLNKRIESMRKQVKSLN